MAADAIKKTQMSNSTFLNDVGSRKNPRMLRERYMMIKAAQKNRMRDTISLCFSCWNSLW
jgi:cystathionine beta-lyase family protein involved in aluminum resistance